MAGRALAVPLSLLQYLVMVAPPGMLTLLVLHASSSSDCLAEWTAATTCCQVAARRGHLRLRGIDPADRRTRARRPSS
jgi:hypothetical protein